MMRLIYTPRSLEDFEHILSRIAEDNPAAAVRLGEDLLKTCTLLKTHPLMGQLKDDLHEGLRRFSCRGYAIYYRVDEQNQTVYVARFLHPKRNVSKEHFQ